MRAQTHRLISPRETIRQYSFACLNAGIARLSDVTGLDKVGIPVVSSARPYSKSVSISMGKGTDFESAYASAMMESIEVYQAEKLPGTHIYSSATKLKIHSNNLIIDEIVMPWVNIEELYDKSLYWVEAIDLLSNKIFLVPHDSVHTDYQARLKVNNTVFHNSTNGLASGNSTDEATVHAICEIIERDSLSIWEQSPTTLKYSQCVDPWTIENPTCRRLLEKFSDAGLFYRILDLSSNLGIPVFMVVLIDNDRSYGDRIRFVAASGCHLRKDIALSRAITEAAQTRLTIIIGSRDDVRNDVYHNQEMVLESSLKFLCLEQSIDYSSLADIHLTTINEELNYLKNILQKTGKEYPDELNKILRIDLKTKELGVPTVKVIIPFLEKPSDDFGYVPGVRMQHMKMQWKSMDL